MTLATAFERNFQSVNTKNWDDFETASRQLSTGHIGWAWGYEYFTVGDSVYKAHWTDVICLDTKRRSGRFECSLSNPTPAYLEVLESK